MYTNVVHVFYIYFLSMCDNTYWITMYRKGVVYSHNTKRRLRIRPGLTINPCLHLSEYMRCSWVVHHIPSCKSYYKRHSYDNVRKQQSNTHSNVQESLRRIFSMDGTSCTDIDYYISCTIHVVVVRM